MPSTEPIEEQAMEKFSSTTFWHLAESHAKAVSTDRTLGQIASCVNAAVVLNSCADNTDVGKIIDKGHVRTSSCMSQTYFPGGSNFKRAREFHVWLADRAGPSLFYSFQN